MFFKKGVSERVKRDLIGKKFGRLLVLDNYIRKNNQTHWQCLCDCGNKTYVYRGNLIRKMSKSCGCSYKTHRLSEHPLYSVWANMKYRCNTKTAKAYKNYGKRGIKVC